MKMKIVGILLLSVAIAISTLPLESYAQITYSKVHFSADSKTVTETRKYKNNNEFPIKYWVQRDQYGGYVYLVKTEKRSDGYWYGTYKGTLYKNVVQP